MFFQQVIFHLRDQRGILRNGRRGGNGGLPTSVGVAAKRRFVGGGRRVKRDARDAAGCLRFHVERARFEDALRRLGPLHRRAGRGEFVRKRFDDRRGASAVRTEVCADVASDL